ncbi:MAG: hypothetical protein FWC97_01060 [Treponema sp.]|nr:hypothetical protein [Treponema sp.]
MKTVLFFFAAIMLLLSVPVFGLEIPALGIEIFVAPLLYIDETELSNLSPPTVQTDLLSALWAVETGVVLRFNRLRNNQISPPQSLTEVVTVARNERIEYLLYGFVTRRAHSVQMEIRLFNYEDRRVEQTFFSMDDSENYDRMMRDMSLKIIAYISGVFNLEIISERTGVTRMSIPVSLGYWTPMERSWVDLMLGTVVAGSGLEFVPTDNLFVFRGNVCYLSTGIELKYRFGIGNPSRYEAVKHTLYITLPLRLNMLLARQHEIFMGVGFVYFLEFFSMADMHNDPRTFVFNNFGINFNFGYRFAFNEDISIFFRNNFDILFNERSLLTYSPVIGMNFQIFNREVRNRW